MVQAKLETAVEKAFRGAGDLVVLGHFRQDQATGFNWTTQSYEPGTSDPEAVEVILFSETRDKGSTVVDTALVRSKDFNGSLYTTLEVGGKPYTINSFVVYGPLTQLELARERITQPEGV